VSHVVVVGDALLDRDLDGEVERLCPEAPVPVVDELVERARPGGAALAAALAAADGHDVTLVTALADDQQGRRLAALLADAGVAVCDLGLDGPTPEKVRVRTDGRLLLRLDYGGRAPSPVRPATGAAGSALARADAVLVADYGRGVAADGCVRAALAALPVPIVWDPHPRGPEPLPGAALVTPNRDEAERLAGSATLPVLAERLRTRWSAGAVAVTLGERGAVVAEAGAPTALVPCAPAPGGDPCGAGDRFASAAACSLAEGAGVAEAVERAVAVASAFVAAGGAAGVARATPAKPTLDRPGSEVVVATGGCFDLLHAGHVRMLETARVLGDRLVVLLNSDESVRRLKGPDRPLVAAEDRATVLRALACVDDVVVFTEDTPEAALGRLRPDIWVKGGDYAPAELPEAAVVERYGGRVEIVPYVQGRSTTRLIEEAARAA
jgi:D-beta-D-heptose 7-phosphate kinase/D-beta-D-heptose 1-phosphate adenosyltransferase